jgi:hypothetical protein
MTTAPPAPRSRCLHPERRANRPFDFAQDKQEFLCYLEGTGARYIVSRLSLGGGAQPGVAVPLVPEIVQWR